MIKGTNTIIINPTAIYTGILNTPLFLIYKYIFYTFVKPMASLKTARIQTLKNSVFISPPFFSSFEPFEYE